MSGTGEAEVVLRRVLRRVLRNTVLSLRGRALAGAERDVLAEGIARQPYVQGWHLAHGEPEDRPAAAARPRPQGREQMACMLAASLAGESFSTDNDAAADLAGLQRWLADLPARQAERLRAAGYRLVREDPEPDPAAPFRDAGPGWWAVESGGHAVVALKTADGLWTIHDTAGQRISHSSKSLASEYYHLVRRLDLGEG